MTFVIAILTALMKVYLIAPHLNSQVRMDTLQPRVLHIPLDALPQVLLKVTLLLNR